MRGSVQTFPCGRAQSGSKQTRIIIIIIITNGSKSNVADAMWQQKQCGSSNVADAMWQQPQGNDQRASTIQGCERHLIEPD